ncbi:MAG: phosphomannomutase [Acidimicrobiaceae bacterium]|nr:phosphomannomutase [Acidimicrobiaceae bacterium]
MPSVPPPSEALRAAAAAWVADDPDPRTRAEVEGLLAAGDGPALAERFESRLEFGTAGLRGKLGAGPNRMNRALVQRAAAGLARYLHARGGGAGGVVIGYDARHQSDEFAVDTAAVMAGAGITAYLLPHPLPTPVLAYAIRYLNADAGVMVTASHNPPEYNGYKVYLGDGAQIIPPTDQEISAQIESVRSLRDVPLAPAGDPRIVVTDERVVDHYLSEALAQSLAPAARDLNIVYTAMHGVGGAIATRLLHEAGFRQVDVVRPQFDPDPDFPTVAFPNPEEPGALDLSVAEARRSHADLVLANDPDADRLGVGVPLGPGGKDWRGLSGDEIGVLLADHILSHTSGDERLVVTSIVSSTMLSRMAAAAGVHFIETLTGFKWLARAVDSHPGWRFVFGYEEALGYCAGTMVRDKDGITAALLFAELVAALKAEGRSVFDRLDDLACAYGAHATQQWSSLLTGADGPARIRDVVHQLRTDPPAELDGWPVTKVVDLQDPESGLPPTDGIILYLGDRVRIIVRPSGTEPKIKVYFEVVTPVCEGNVAEARARGAATVARLKQAMATITGLPT